MRIEELMSSPVVSLLAEQSLPLAREIMGMCRVHHLPVIDATGRLVGLVSARDLVRWADLAAEARREQRDELCVDQIMTRDVWTVGPEMSAVVVGRVMLERRLGCAPVVDASGRVIGIVTDADFIRLALESPLLAENQELP